MSFTRSLLCFGIPISIICASWKSVSNPLRVKQNAFPHDNCEEEMLIGCAKFIDTNCHWITEYNNFSTETFNQTLPSMKIMRLRDDFVTSNGKRIPVMRIISVFPKVRPQTLYDLLTECSLRLKWDTNYMLFEKLSGPNLHTDNIPAFCSPNVKTSFLEGSWFQHCVGSAVLAKFGVDSRHFCYHRWCFQHRIPQSGPIKKFLEGFTIIYDGSEKRREMVLQHNDKISLPHSLIRCNMNYQHIVLLPISDVTAQDFTDKFSEIEYSGSFLTSTSKMFDFLRHNYNKELGCGASGSEGTLFMITSVNDVAIPRSMPRWAEKKISSLVSTSVYNALMNAALLHEKSLLPQSF